MRKTYAWGLLWQSTNRLDGERRQLMGRYSLGNPDAPEHLAGYNTMAFRTRAEARAYIEKHYGYIRHRPDLRLEPHGWKMPVPVKIEVRVFSVLEDAA